MSCPPGKVIGVHCGVRKRKFPRCRVLRGPARRSTTTTSMAGCSTLTVRSTSWPDWPQEGGSSSSGLVRARIAIPLAERSLEVWGVDGSPAMLERLRAKDGGRQGQDSLRGFRDSQSRGRNSISSCCWSTPSMPCPVKTIRSACFANAARHLAPGGRFVVEAWVPDPPRGDGLGLRARRLGRGFAGLVIEDHDAGRQILSTTQIVISETGETRSFPVVHRYAWPAELDLMARLNGMTLEDRWADWHCRPFDSQQHGSHLCVAVDRP